MSAYAERPGPDWGLLARRILVVTAAVVLVLALVAMIVSYASLRSFYVSCGLPDWMASLYPLCIDLLALVAYVAWLAIGGAYPAIVVALTVLGSASAQGFHVANGGIAAPVHGWAILALAGASAVLAAGLAFHLFVMIVKRSVPADFMASLRGGAATLYPAAPTPAEPATMPDLRKRENDAQWQELLRGEAELDDRQADKLLETIREPEDPFPDMGKLLVDYDNDLAKHNGGRTRPATIHRPRVTQRTGGQPSQQDGPCVDGCPHHTGDVSKSARYRCAATLEGRARTCAPCLRSREVSHG